MGSDEKNVKNRTSLESFDVFDFLKILWKKRIFILKVVFIFFILGIIIAFLSLNKYQSFTTVVPQTSSGNVGGNLGGLAAIAGINLSNMEGGTDISPVLYPKIFKSISFQKSIMDEKLNFDFNSDPITFREYYTKYYNPGLLSKIKKYTIGLPGTLLKAFKGSNKSIGNDVFSNRDDSLKGVSEEERGLIERLSDQLQIEVNDRDGYITITGIMPEPYAAAQLTEKARNLLQNFIIESHIEKAKIQLEYLEQRLAEKREEFNVAQLHLAKFKDRNLYNNTATSNTQLEKLQSEYDLTYGVYSELAKQVETQRLQVKRDTPVFTVIEEPIIPDKKFAPSRLGIIIATSVLGFFVSALYVFISKLFLFVKKRIHTF